ncbi:MAG TPA: hypothetical protein VIK52_11390 [Opitutaceae bacterium]
MIQRESDARSVEAIFIGVSSAAVVSVVLANVIRVTVSPEAALQVRAVLFIASWVAAVAWAVAARHKAALAWFGVLAGCGALIAFCQAFAGGVSGSSLLQLVGAGGAGVGAALLIQRCLDGKRAAWAAGVAALFGCGAAIWLALEPEHELWKLLPNNWELSKNLDYRWGIRMGQDRARFLFDTPMEAGVVQWFLGSLCLVTAMTKSASLLTRGLLGLVALLLFASVALTFSRAGLVLGIFSIGLGILMSIHSRRTTIIASICAAVILAVAAIAANRIAEDKNPVVKNVASIFDPAEEANRIRLGQFGKIGKDLAETRWHGEGASTFVTFQDAPRMPEHESSPVGLIVAFGWGGGALVLAFVWQVLSRRQEFMEVIVNKEFAPLSGFRRFVAISVLPFAIYSLVAPVLSGITFAMICFTLMGLLSIWETPLKAYSGKP